MKDGNNYYLYAGANPLKFIDPTGLKKTEAEKEAERAARRAEREKRREERRKRREETKEKIRKNKEDREKKREELKNAGSRTERKLIRAKYGYKAAQNAITDLGRKIRTSLADDNMRSAFSEIMESGFDMSEGEVNQLIGAVSSLTELEGGGPAAVQAPTGADINATFSNVTQGITPVSLGSLVDTASLADIYTNTIRGTFYQGGLALGAIDSMGQTNLGGFLSSLQVFQGVNMNKIASFTGISKNPSALSFGSFIFSGSTYTSGSLTGAQSRVLAHESVHALQAYGMGDLMRYKDDYYNKLNQSLNRHPNNQDAGYRNSYYEVEAYAVQRELRGLWP